MLSATDFSEGRRRSIPRGSRHSRHSGVSPSLPALDCPSVRPAVCALHSRGGTPHPPGLPSPSLARLTAHGSATSRRHPYGSHSQEAGLCVPSEHTGTVATPQPPLTWRLGTVAHARPCTELCASAVDRLAQPACGVSSLLTVPTHSTGHGPQARMRVRPGLRLPPTTAAWPSLQTLGTARARSHPAASFPLLRPGRSRPEEARPALPVSAGQEGALGPCPWAPTGQLPLR